MAVSNCCSKINFGLVGAGVLVCFFSLDFLKFILNNWARFVFVAAMSWCCWVPKRGFLHTESPQPILFLDSLRALNFISFFPSAASRYKTRLCFLQERWANKASPVYKFLECWNHLCALFPSKQSRDNGERILLLVLWEAPTAFYFELGFNVSDLILWAG